MKKSRSNRGKPHVISGHAGFKEGPDAEYAVGEVSTTTLDTWVVAAVSDHADQKKRDQTFHYVQEIFQGRVDDDVVHAVLAECDWQGEEAIEQLLELFSSNKETVIEPEKRPESKTTLRAVAESWLKNNSSDCVSEVAQTEALCSPSCSQLVLSSKHNHVMQKTVSNSTPHSTPHSNFVDNSRSGSFSDKSSVDLGSVSKLRNQQLGALDSSVQNKAVSSHRSLFVNDTPNVATSNNSLLLVEETGCKGSFTDGPSVQSLLDRDDIYYSDDETCIEPACDAVIQPTVNMNSEWPLRSRNFAQPDNKMMASISPYSSGLKVYASNPLPTTGQRFSVDQRKYLLSSTPASDYCHKDTNNKDFIVPRLPVQLRHSPTELNPVRLGSPICSHQRLDLMQTMSQSMFTSPRAIYSSSVGLTRAVHPTVSAKLQENKTNSTVMSTETAKCKVLGLLQQNRKVMILMRGCPGSGKTTLAREIQFSGVILSADAFFERNGKYEYDHAKIGDAHAQSKQLALIAVKKGISPVIIDNTNTKAWEMLPYVEMAVDYNYRVEVIEPDVRWRLKAKQLAKHNVHGVPADKLASMIERYEHNITATKLLEVVHSKRLLASQAATLNQLTPPLLAQQHPPLKQQQQLSRQSLQMLMQQQQLLMQPQQLLMQPKQLLMQPQQLLMQPQQLLMQPEMPVPTQVTERKEELEKKKLYKLAQKRHKRQLKKLATKETEASVSTAADAAAAAAAAAASSDSSEDESHREKEDVHRRSVAGSNKQDIVQQLDFRIFPHGYATVLPQGSADSNGGMSSESPILASYKSCENGFLPQTTKAKLMGDSESGEKSQPQPDMKSSANHSIRLSESSSQVLPVTTSPETCDRMALGDNAISEVDLSSNQMEQRPDLEIFEEEEIEILSSPSESSFVNNPPSLDNQDELQSLSSAGAINSLDNTSDFISADRFDEECAEASQAVLPESSQFVRNSDEPSRNQLPSEMSSSLELDYWSRKDAIDHPYSIQGSRKENHSLATGESSWSEQDSDDSANIICSSQSNGSVNPKPQRIVKERKLTVKKAADVQVKLVGGDSDSSTDSKTAASVLLPVTLKQPSVSLASPTVVFPVSQLPKKASQDSLTQIEASDLVAVYRLENGKHFDASLFSCILTAKPRDIIDRELAILSQIELDKRISAISKRNESTMTDELDHANADAKMAFLGSCFPTVVHDDMHYILHSCGNDMDLAANILLDSGYEYNKPNQNAARSPKSPPTDSFSDDDAIAIKHTPSKVHQKMGIGLDRFRVLYTLCRDSVKPKVVTSVECSRGRRDKKVQGSGLVQENCSLPGPQQLSSYDEKITMSLTPGFAAQLVELFGPVDSSSPSGLMPDSGLSVNLSFELASQVYDSWVATQKRMQTNPRNKSKDTPSGSSPVQTSDVQMAGAFSNFPDSNSFPTFPQKLQEASDRDDNDTFPALSTSLPVIVPDVKARNLSTKIKRQQLAERYPMINTTILDEIYEATGFSYDITIKTIAACPELIAPPKVVMTKKKAEELELQLIERAIEESVKDQVSKGLREAVRNADCDEVYEDLMSEACVYFNCYQENLQKAQEAHCKKLHPVAMHHSQRAGHYKDKFQETQQMAAEMIMKTRLSDLSSRRSIDLHGFSVREAIQLLEQSLSLREDELLESQDKRRAFLNVITGRGSHSHRKLARIKPAVEAYLSRNNYEFVESTPGVLKVRLHVGF